MNYVVSGADRTTGKELTLRFQASSPAEAEAFASLSMLVSEMREEQSAVEPVAYATPDSAKTAVEVNWAAGIAFHARLLRILSIVLALMAILPLAEYFWELGAGLWNLMVERTLATAFAMAQDAVTSPRLIFAVALIAVAVFMRLAAHAALALRDLASKS